MTTTTVRIQQNAFICRSTGLQQKLHTSIIQWNKWHQTSRISCLAAFSCTQLTNSTLLLNSDARHLRGNEQQSINTNFYIFFCKVFMQCMHTGRSYKGYMHISFLQTIVIEINTLMGFGYRSCSLEVQRLSICGTFQKAKEWKGGSQDEKRPGCRSGQVKVAECWWSSVLVWWILWWRTFLSASMELTCRSLLKK